MSSQMQIFSIPLSGRIVQASSFRGHGDMHADRLSQGHKAPRPSVWGYVNGLPSYEHVIDLSQGRYIPKSMAGTVPVAYTCPMCVTTCL